MSIGFLLGCGALDYSQSEGDVATTWNFLGQLVHPGPRPGTSRSLPTRAARGQGCPEEATAERQLEQGRALASVKAGHH